MSTHNLNPILIISYNEEIRNSMIKTLQSYDVIPEACESFLEAEKLALSGLYSGILVDLTALVKAKGEDRIVSTSLGNVFPMLRVKSMGSMLIPMTLSGGSSQDKSLPDFLFKTCSNFVSRRLRSCKRHRYFTPVIVGHLDKNIQLYTQDLSWGGSYISCNSSDRFQIGDEITVEFPFLEINILAVICRINYWGVHAQLPGIGVRWHSPVSAEIEAVFNKNLRTAKGHDLDRVVG